MRRTTILISLVLWACGAWAAGGTAARQPTNIPEQSLDSALQRLAKDRGLQMVYSYTVVGELRTRAVNGDFTFEEALSQMLKGTELTYRFIDEKTVTIVRKGAAAGSADSSPADQMRVAVADGKDRQGDASGSADSSDADRNSMTVRDRKVKPFRDANADIPRTINDAQPYYIFDSRTLEASGAGSIEDFLKQRLTMNTVAMTNGQNSGAGSNRGTTSTINLRGVGADKTLILVNGRRMAAVNVMSDDFQPDLNGIPLSAIDRIEVLPSSASGIYGGSAIGGVVNVILKRDYQGGEVRVGYDDTWDGDSPRRNVSASYGLSLEEGRTHLSLGADWSDMQPLLLQDRVGLFLNNRASIQSRSPNFFYSDANPWLGSVPNIRANGSAPLTLRPEYGGTALNSPYAHVPAGTAPGTSKAALGAALAANAGQWNMDFPPGTQASTGLQRPFGSTPENRSLRAAVRRQMLPWLELTAELSWNDNRSQSIYHPLIYMSVPEANPAVGAPNPLTSNPFTTRVLMTVPDASRIPSDARSQNRSATLGAQMQLPRGWTGLLDYTWSENRFDYVQYNQDSTGLSADLANGTLNPFVDTLLYPLDLQRYLYSLNYQGENRLQALALRGSGPLPALPWGQPQLTAGLERRVARTPERTLDAAFPITVMTSYLQLYYERESTTDSGYLETTVPLVKAGWLPGLHALDLQLSGRGERYTVDAGTSYKQTYYNRTPPTSIYSGPTLNNQPYFSEASYTSTNYTMGLKYQPVKDLTLRVSRATAFLPPAPAQLIMNPLPSTNQTNVIDPTLNPSGPLPPLCTVLNNQVRCPAYSLSGGNPNLEPQNSRSLNAGIIWEPTWQRLSGLRLNAEYYRIEQFDAIGSLGVQGIVNQESTYPGRVTRNAAGAITLVDNSLVNLYHRETAGWDLSANYTLETAMGRFSVNAAQSIMLHLKNQFSQTLPEFDAAGYHPEEGGAAKYKSNLILNWERQQWTLGWAARYFSSYKQYGAAGGPLSIQIANGGVATTSYIIAQGSETVPSQMYHDLFVSYSFGKGAPGFARSGSLLSNLALQFGMRNVFDKAPPLDAFQGNYYYFSSYGDMRLRSYWLNARLSF